MFRVLKNFNLLFGEGTYENLSEVPKFGLKLLALKVVLYSYAKMSLIL